MDNKLLLFIFDINITSVFYRCQRGGWHVMSAGGSLMIIYTCTPFVCQLTRWTPASATYQLLTVVQLYQWIIMCGLQCWNTIKDACYSWPTSCRAERPFCRRYRMICFTSSFIRQLYQFASDLDRVLLQLVGTYIVNTLFEYRVTYRHLPFMIETLELLIHYL